MTPRTVPLPLPDPALGGDGFDLRPWATDDRAALVAAWQDPDVVRWTAVPTDTSEDHAARWIAGESHRRAQGLAVDLVIDVGGEVAGEVGLASIDCARRIAEVGWWLAPPHRGRGLAGDAVGLFCTWAVDELCVDAVVARCDPANPASGGVARRAGFEYHGQVDGADVWAFGAVGAAMLPS